MPGNLIFTEAVATYMIVAGNIGFSVSCTSFVDSFLIGVTCDEKVFDNPQRVVDLM
jgi:hypothetical protein